MIRTDIINNLINRYNFNSYLEIGIDMASNYLQVNCRNKECVDPYDFQEGKEYKDLFSMEENAGIKKYIENNILTYKMTSDEFFSKLPADKMYDIIFIDGLHTEEQVGKDIINSIKHLNAGGFIVVHDCLPTSYESQLEDRESGIWFGSTWKAIPMLKFQGIPYFTVDTDCGCCIIQFDGDKNSLYYPQKAPYDYNDVFSNMLIRNIVMSVITEEQFLGLIK